MDIFFDMPNLSVDNLTQLHDREAMVSYIDHLMTLKTPFTMALIDIDNFTYINENYGHIAGDKIICEVAERVKNQIGDNGVVGRFGGDEFIVVMPNFVKYDEIWQVCHKIQVNMSECEFQACSGLYVTVTIGLSRFPENAQSYDKLIENADKALYRGKTKGRNCFIIYLPEKHANIVLKTEKDRQLSSMYLHSIVFSNLTKTENLRDGVKSLFDFICSYYMIDHLCIQTEEDGSGNGSIWYEKIHPLSKAKSFKPLKLSLIRNYLNNTIEMLYLNDTKQLMRANQNDLYEALCEQRVTSTCCVNIAYKDEFFGMLRADMTGVAGSSRIWQYGDMDILLTAAKTIALILHFTGKTLSSLD